ncbi:hypothetical protein B0I35DRAFT_403483 [Stachybotrys elegans]|uniref:Uncharacterized protein n=1 Tax=Stachybotrys elegans TaxID=80388 RepID=A0A8K0WVW8_9HYPO|nr:hypothetical protein B0I35DRAFT_403483 [Stachybotrys elegans]
MRLLPAYAAQWLCCMRLSTLLPPPLDAANALVSVICSSSSVSSRRSREHASEPVSSWLSLLKSEPHNFGAKRLIGLITRLMNTTNESTGTRPRNGPRSTTLPSPGSHMNASSHTYLFHREQAEPLITHSVLDS